MSAKWLGVRKVRLDTIVLPGGFSKRKRLDHVARLAASIKRGGVISLPVVEERSRKLVAGGDRLAALQLLKVGQHEVRMVSGSKEELEAITIEENLHRRRGDDYDALTKRLVELTQEEQAGTGEHVHAFVDVEDEGDGVSAACECGETRGADPVTGKPFPANLAGKSEPAKRGRPKTEHGAAREEVAAKLGKTPEAVRQAEKRAKAKEREEKEAAVPREERLPEKPPLTTYGVQLSPELVLAIVDAQNQIDAADSFLRRAQGAITTLGKQGSLGGPLEFRIRTALHTAADTVRRERPDSICPCCKLIQPAQSKCMFCGGIGVVSNDKVATVDPKLLLSGDKAMVLDGRGGLVPYSREAAPTPKATPAKGARKLRIEDEKGNPINIDDLPSRDVNEDTENDPF